MWRRLSTLALIGGILSFNAWLVFAACRIPLPSPDHPVLFYSNQTRQDIHRLFSQAILKASQSIYLSVYGISDSYLIEHIRRRSQDLLCIRIEYDPSASVPLKQQLPGSIHTLPIKAKGLMHRKIAVFDHAQVFLGSANFTTTSLKHHSNLVIGFHHPLLAAYLEDPFSNSFSFTTDTLQGTLFLLPDPSQRCLHKLLHTLNQAKKTIRLAMFTLTHEEIALALIAAQARGVDVRIAIDYYTARGASKKTLDRLKQAHIPIYLSQGKELLHHKWALVDSDTLLTGSANWTKAAFTKNQDFLLLLSSLKPDHQRFFHRLWEIIQTESTCEENL